MITRLASYNSFPLTPLRVGIRMLLRKRLRALTHDGIEAANEAKTRLIQSLSESPVALQVEQANLQHYEVPAKFFQMVLGRNLKYSSALWPQGCHSLDEAEDKMLSLYCSRAGIQDGMSILELGCGWGSLSLYLARKFPNSTVVGVSNSRSQKSHIDAAAQSEGIKNLDIITSDMNTFSLERSFDRVVSIEMFEHMRNWKTLFSRISGWLSDEGKLFFHIFVHRSYPYLFEVRSSLDWMAKYFFSGGMMPSHDMPLWMQSELQIERSWVVSGVHYSKTARAWRENLERMREEVMPILASTHGAPEAEAAYGRWRLFFLACEELFGFRGGGEWHVSHYLFSKRAG
ncbi:MAG: class I SAM-dependent methyltransferase [Deltaproteobacteria bacterium]|nr:class I SAM-dependent methyltransferase [Deltaproteobacteria bacterium]